MRGRERLSRALAPRLLLGGVVLLLIAAASPPQARVGYVIDGDTFRLTGGERIRIAGIDAPETRVGQSKCQNEITLGTAATAQARALLDDRTVTIVRVGRSYNRTVARVSLDGQDLATVLVRIGVARRWPRWSAKPDWCGGRQRPKRAATRRRAPAR
ncbi:thermonuclease family protein [Sphingomonas koreensis]|nr:thermonuclease family protein [Sphingomonas koreensis]